MDFQKYINTLEYPKCPLRPELPENPTQDDAIKYGENLAEWIAISKKHKENIQNYREEDRKLFNQFKKDAIEDVGLTKHSKADLAFEMARERGHSDGLQEILNELINLAELLL